MLKVISYIDLGITGNVMDGEKRADALEAGLMFYDIMRLARKGVCRSKWRFCKL